jgi:hypothetical protein
MMMKTRLLFLVLILLALSCTTEEACEEDTISELVAVCKTEKEGAVVDTALPDLSIYGIREGQPTWLLYDSVTRSEILLPLDPHHDYSRFVFQAGEHTDTLILHHRTEIYLISYSCGFGNLFTLGDIQYEAGWIVKDSIIHPVVNTSLEEIDSHIWLYF